MLSISHLIPPNDYDLRSNRIDIWFVPLDIEPFQAKALLNEEELSRANRFYFDRHRRRFTVARAMLRLLLGRYLNQDASLLAFDYNEHGKPELKQAHRLEFNLSHSRESALIAIGQDYPLGIDLEFFSARPYEGIAKSLFSQKELATFLKLPGYLKPQAFFHIWAQKEAFIKACGMGLAYPTKDFDVPVFSPAKELVADNLHKKEWMLRSFMPLVTCAGALCHHSQVEEIRFFTLKNCLDFFNS